MYQAFAEYYDRIFPVSTSQIDFVRTVTAAVSAHTLLDIGCGTASLLLAVEHSLDRAAGIDLDEAMIAVAGRKAEVSGSRAELLCANMLEVGELFPPESFDVVLCMGNTIAHLGSERELSAFIADLFTILSPGGMFVIQGINYRNISADERFAFPPIRAGDLSFTRSYLPVEGENRLMFTTELASGDRVLFRGRTPHTPYYAGQLERICSSVGFSDLHSYGDFNRSAFTDESFPLVVTGMKPGC